jgi:very-short-patch-repair endonuclease
MLVRMTRVTRETLRTERREAGVAAGTGIDPGNASYRVKLLGVRSLFRVSGTPDQRIAAIAGMQRGRVARRQLLVVELTGNMIDHRVARARLHRVHAGVYAVGHLAPIELGRETAALLAVADGAYLSHGSAAALWGLCPPIGSDEPVEITVVGGRSVARAGILAHRTDHLDERDTRIYRRLPVTSPARTLFDIAGTRSDDEVEQALDDCLWHKLVQPHEIRDVLDRSGRGRKGAALLGALLDERLNRPSTSRSRYERILRELIRAADLPEPEMNVPLHGYVVDCVWRELRIVVEVDGYVYHGNRTKFESDRRRDAVLEAAGWTVIRITRRQLDQEPYAVIARLAQALMWVERSSVA